MNENQAIAMVGMAVEEDKITCGDCGRTVDVSEGDSELQVLAILNNHKEVHHD